MAEDKKVETVSAAWNIYYDDPVDRPCQYEITEPLKPEMFFTKPKEIKNAKLVDLIGNKFINKRGTTEREREETSLTEEIQADYFQPCKFIGLFFAAGNAAPCKVMLKHLKYFYSDINLQTR